MSKRIVQLLSLFVAESVTAQHVGVTSTTINVKDFGAVGDGSHDDTVQIQNAFNALMEIKSGEIVFPAGTYRFGPITFTHLENSRIHFQSGVALYMLDDVEQWKKYSTDTDWIRGEYCNGLEIKGGRFHGNSAYWNNHYVPHKDDPRPAMFRFKHGTDFEMHGSDLLDAPHEHIEMNYMDGVQLHDLELKATIHSSNTDGIGLGSVTNAVVQRVAVQNGDDCLKVSGTSSDITFLNCSCTGGHGLSLGGGAKSLEVQRVNYSDIDLLGMSNGARIKFTTETDGYIRDVTWEHIRMTNVRSPMTIESTYQSSLPSSHSFELGDLYYTDITAVYDKHQETGSGKDYNTEPGKFSCDDSAPCPKLHLTDVTIETDEEWICSKAKGKSSNVSPRLKCLSESDLAVV